jgi:hypothetical protein
MKSDTNSTTKWKSGWPQTPGRSSIQGQPDAYPAQGYTQPINKAELWHPGYRPLFLDPSATVIALNVIFGVFFAPSRLPALHLNVLRETGFVCL